MNEEVHLKNLESSLKAAVERLRTELGGIRSNRPSPELIENIKVSCYDQMLGLRELGAISAVPPRDIQISVWDAQAVGPVMKALEAARIGLSVSNDGNIIHARLSELSLERREELLKTVKKTAEETRIQIRRERDETMKGVKAAEEAGELPKDRAFKLKEKIQKTVEAANADVEALVQKKFTEIGN